MYSENNFRRTSFHDDQLSDQVRSHFKQSNDAHTLHWQQNFRFVVLAQRLTYIIRVACLAPGSSRLCSDWHLDVVLLPD